LHREPQWLLRSSDFMDTDVVHEHDVASLQGRNENQFGIGLEHLAGHRPFEHKSRGNTIMTQLAISHFTASATSSSASSTKLSTFEPLRPATTNSPEIFPQPSNWSRLSSFSTSQLRTGARDRFGSCLWRTSRRAHRLRHNDDFMKSWQPVCNLAILRSSSISER
jgi:hypothetical protein